MMKESGREAHQPHPNKSSSFRYYLPLMINSTHTKKYQLVLSSDIVNQRILQSDWMRGTPHPTKKGSPRCFLLLMTNSMPKKLIYQLILFRNIDDQRILPSDWIRCLTGHTQSKVVVSVQLVGLNW